MKIGFGCDHAAIDLKNELIEYMTEKGYECVDYGTNYDESGFQTMIPSKYVEGKDYKIAIAFYVDQERYILKTDQEFVVEDEED